jgi:hypothetical protein
LCWKEGTPDWIPLAAHEDVIEEADAGLRAAPRRSPFARLGLAIGFSLALAAIGVVAYLASDSSSRWTTAPAAPSDTPGNDEPVIWQLSQPTGPLPQSTAPRALQGNAPRAPNPAAGRPPGAAAPPKVEREATGRLSEADQKIETEVQQLCEKGAEAIARDDLGAARRYYRQAQDAARGRSELMAQADQGLQWLDLTENPAARFAITGAMTAGKTRVKIYDTRDAANYDVQTGEAFAGYTLDAYDAKTRSARISARGRRFTISRH